jgi:hypothetical protein
MPKPKMKRFYFIWFFVCIIWGYLAAQPVPAGFTPPASSAFLAFPASAFWIFVLLAYEAWRAGPHHRLSSPSLALKPWNMPTGVMLFVLTTFLFASIWGCAFGVVLASASMQGPVHLLALSSGGLAGLFLAPRILVSRFHA